MKKRTKDKIIKCVNGSISILLSVILTGMLSLAALLVEGARFQQAQQQIEEASLNSAISLLASCNPNLMKRFGLYGIDSANTSSDAFLKYLLFNSDQDDTGTYAANGISRLYDVESGEYQLMHDLANYQVLKRQLLEYEKFRGPINIAADLIDIDKLLKKLKESLIKAIPGLDKCLEICDAVSDLADAFKKTYNLVKNVQQLQLMINSGGEETLMDSLNTLFGDVWKTVEETFTDSEWPDYDPSYIEAYDAFEAAVNEKVDYMSSNPPPPDPGPKPTDDVPALKSAYDTAYAKHKEASLTYTLLGYVLSLSYCDASGVVNSSENIEELIEDLEGLGMTESELRSYGISSSTSRGSLLSTLNSKISTLLGADEAMDEYTRSEVSRVSSALSTELSELYSDMQSKYNTYSAAQQRLDNWTAKKEAYDAYEAKIDEYNTAIESAKSALISIASSTASQFDSYRSALNEMVSALNSAHDAAVKLEQIENGENIEDTDDSSDVFMELANQLTDIELQKPQAGIEFLNDQLDYLRSLSADDIDASYVFSSHFNTGRLQDDGIYYMTKSQVMFFIAALEGLQITSDIAGFFDILKALVGLIEIVSPVPYVSEIDCNVELKDPTWNILPSQTAASAPDTNAADKSTISAGLTDASGKVGGAYAGDINSVNPNITSHEQLIEDEVTSRIENLTDNFASLVANDDISTMLGGYGFILIEVVMTVFDSLTTIIEIIDDLIFLCSNIGTTIDVLLSSLGENVLINQYIVEMFPNRTTDENDNNQNEEIKGWYGENRVYFPDNSKPVQTFSGAQVEYVIGGSKSEQSNQIQCFWTLFLIRALVNIVGVVNTPEVMELIAACNVAAPVVFILWVYLESNIDMNLLLKGKEVPLFKDNIILSIDGITNIFKAVEIAEDSLNDEDATDDDMSYAAMKVDLLLESVEKSITGMGKMKYKDYLWFFMFLMSNNTKIERVADLIQMEMRYKSYYGGDVAKSKIGENFLLSNMHTYIRCEAEGTFNPLLPIMSMKSGGVGGPGLVVRSTKYVGY